MLDSELIHLRGRKMRKVMMAAAAASAFAVSGCATIIDSGSQTISFNSTPSGATVTVVDSSGTTVFTGVTPTSADLSNGAGFFQAETYTVTVANETTSKQVVMKGDFNTWTIGNIFLGGIIGLAVDASTGAMWAFKPDVVNVDLGTSADLQVKSLEDLSETERATLLLL